MATRFTPFLVVLVFGCGITQARSRIPIGQLNEKEALDGVKQVRAQTPIGQAHQYERLGGVKQQARSQIPVGQTNQYESFDGVKQQAKFQIPVGQTKQHEGLGVEKQQSRSQIPLRQTNQYGGFGVNVDGKEKEVLQKKLPEGLQDNKFLIHGAEGNFVTNKITFKTFLRELITKWCLHVLRKGRSNLFVDLACVAAGGPYLVPDDTCRQGVFLSTSVDMKYNTVVGFGRSSLLRAYSIIN